MEEIELLFDQHYPDQWGKFLKFCDRVEKIIHHDFGDKTFLYNALSVRGSRLPSDKFERYEFLGDSILKAIQGILLYERNEEYNPGELTRIRSELERNENLATISGDLFLDELAKIFGLGKFTPSQAADAIEALIGAIFLDVNNDFDATMAIVKGFTHFDKRLKQLGKDPWGTKDPKSFLQEYVQKTYSGDAEIVYEKQNEGTSNAPLRSAKASIKVKSSGKIEMNGPWGITQSKEKDAEKEAAKALLKQMQEAGLIE